MEFGELLDNYIKEIGCSAKELATLSDVSASVISRYRTGERVPSPEHEVVRKLAKGIDKLSDQNEEVIYNQLVATLTSKSSFAKHAFHKVNRLVSELYLKQADIARTFNYDASFISRVLSGQRFPSDIDGFLEDISTYVSQNVTSESQLSTLSSIIFISDSQLQTETDRYNAVLNWLKQSDTPTYNFLSSLNDFDINQYLSTLHFDGINVPSVPFSLPTTKLYHGIQEMKNGEIDFFKTAALSKSTEDVYMYTDMSMEDMLDSSFPKKYMIGLATLVKKGLHLHVIHNLNRPERELFLGLEAWLPIYMTGQVTPYCFEGLKDDVFGHLTYSAGTVALFGSSISGLRKNGLYYLTKNQTEVDYYRQRSKDMLTKATPLIQIFKKNNSDGFIKELNNTINHSDNFVFNLYAPPIISATEELVTKIIKDYTKSAESNKLSFSEIKHKVMNAQKIEKEIMEPLENREVYCRIHVLSKKEFDIYPIYLSLSFGFYELSIPYTYETYMEHIELTRQEAKKRKKLKLEVVEGAVFRNISIRTGTLTYKTKDKNGNQTTTEKSWALVTKSLLPATHFLTTNPTLVNSLRQVEKPLKDQGE